MAYDQNFTGAYSGRNQFQLRLYVHRASTSGNSSSYGWYLVAEKIAASTAWASNQFPWNINIAGYTASGTGSLDFRSTNSILMGSGGTGWVGHDGNGYLNFSTYAYHQGGGLIGWAAAGGTFSADRIAQLPSAPYAQSISQVTAVSMVFQFGSGPSDGGSPINLWEVQYATNSAFTTGVMNVNGHNGLMTMQNLTPGTQYWVRARGRNGVGWGPYSGALTASTLSGAFVGRLNNPTFAPAAVYVGKNNAYALASVYVGKNGSFVIAN